MYSPSTYICLLYVYCLPSICLLQRRYVYHLPSVGLQNLLSVSLLSPSVYLLIAFSSTLVFAQHFLVSFWYSVHASSYEDKRFYIYLPAYVLKNGICEPAYKLYFCKLSGYDCKRDVGSLPLYWKVTAHA